MEKISNGAILLSCLFAVLFAVEMMASQGVSAVHMACVLIMFQVAVLLKQSSIAKTLKESK